MSRRQSELPRQVRGAVLLLALAGAATLEGAEPGLRLVSETVLPAHLERARDVRWASSESVYLAVSLTGTVELALDPVGNDVKQVIPDGHGPEAIWLTSRLGASDAYLAAAAPVFLVGWKSRSTAGLQGREVFEDIEDIDVAANRLVVLGFRRDEKGRIASDGAIAWMGSLDLGLTDLKAVAFSQAGVGARPMDSCANFEIGAVRFLPDGTFVVLPGAESGVFLFDSEGRLLHTWETTALGLDRLCDFDDPQRDLFSRNPLARWAWINQFRTVDEVLPLPEGPGLVIRKVAAAGTGWELTLLRRTGSARTSELPISSPSSNAHLRADIRGQRVAFLIYDEASSFEEGPKKEAAKLPRLIVGELSAGEG